MNNPLSSAIQSEFVQEAESTRKLLQAVQDKDLDYKPAENSWTMAQLASHIASIYDWYPATMLQDDFDMATYHYEREDRSKAANIVAKFEENAAKAKSAVEKLTDESLAKTWRMVQGEKELMPPMPRGIAIRGFLMNHLYHHRGELIVYLRATGNIVPGLYGPTWEDTHPGEKFVSS